MNKSIQTIENDILKHGRRKSAIKENVTGYLLILPLLVGLIIFTIYPLLVSLYNSFFLNYDGFNPRSEFEFGLGNYIQAFNGYESSVFFKALGITFSYAIIMVPLGLVLSFIVALFLNQKIRGITVFRLIYYIPCLIPSIVNAIIFGYIFNAEDYGLINNFFTSIGLPAHEFFYSETSEAVISFAIMSLFGVGGSMLIWLAGLKSVPTSYYEAATIEGSGYFHKLFKITIPLCTPYIFYQLVTSVIGTLQICDQVYVLSSTGGRNNSLMFYGVYIYRTFKLNNFGYAAALAYMLFIVIAALSMILFKFNKYVYYEGDD